MKMSDVKSILLALALAAAIPTTALAQSEGIKVHGRWVIEVQNPDGTVVERREFNNALSTGGHSTLAGLLGARNAVAGRWAVYLGNSSGGVGPCQGGTDAAFGSFCQIIESAASNFNGGTAESRDLVVTYTGTSVSMTGTITALGNSSITRVATGLGWCFSAPCETAGSALFFSDKSLAAVPIVIGQIIKVTVTFTFS
jgi:hypothetical protein